MGGGESEDVLCKVRGVNFWPQDGEALGGKC